MNWDKCADWDYEKELDEFHKRADRESERRLLDEFAMAALPATLTAWRYLLTDPESPVEEDEYFQTAASEAYDIADAMLAERVRRCAEK